MLIISCLLKNRIFSLNDELARWNVSKWILSVTFNVEIRLLLPVVRDRNGTNFLLVREVTLDEHHQPVANCDGLWSVCN